MQLAFLFLYGFSCLNQLHASEADSLFVAKIRQRLEVVNTYLDSRQYIRSISLLDSLNKDIVARFGEDHFLLAEVEIRRGDLFDYKGDYRKGWEAFEKALSIYENQSPPDSVKIAKCLNLVGRMVGYAGEYELAISYYEKSLELNLRLYGKDHASVSTDYMNLGVNYESRGDYGQALNFYQKALQIRLEQYGRNHALTGDVLHNIGNAYFYLGEFDVAWDYYQQALQIWQKSLGKTHSRIAYSYLSLAIIQAEKGDYPLALTYFEKELEIKKLNYSPLHPDLAYSYNNVGLLFFRMKAFQRSLDSYQKALEICLRAFGKKHPYLAETYANFAEVYRQQGDLAQALLYNQRALIATHKYFNSENLKDNPQVTGGLDNRQLMRYLGEKANLFYLLYKQKTNEPGDLALALEIYELAGQLIDEMRKSYRAEDSKLFLQQNALPIYERGIQAAWILFQESGDKQFMERAFALSEKSKATLLLSSLNELKARKFSHIPTHVLDQLQQLKADLSFYERQTEQAVDSLSKSNFQNVYFDLKQKYDSLIADMEESYPQYYQLKFENRVAKLSDLQRLIPHDSLAIIVYFVGDSSLFAFSIDQEESHFISLSLPSDLGKAVFQMRQYIYTYFLTTQKSDSLYNLFAQKFDQVSFSLFESLIKPIRDRIGAKKNQWIIIPDGVLGYLPFEALIMTPPAASAQYKHYPFLIRDLRISYNFSATLWIGNQNKDDRLEKKARLLAVAPEFRQTEELYTEVEPLRRNGLGPLLYNTAEAQTIHRIMGGELLAGEDATYRRVFERAPGFSLIHLATHGKVDDDDEDYSFLAFAENQDSTSQTRLYVNDIYNWDTPAEMVVLSACETGIGTLHKGEGISSLARAFSYAGAKSIITTLWSINDAQTARIMELFYSKLSIGQSKDEALRQAKLDYIAEQDHYHAHPFFWSAYIPVGNMRPLSNVGIGNKFLLWIIIVLALVGLGWYIVSKRNN